MSEFTLDTSGTVEGVRAPRQLGTIQPVDLDWCDLDAFTQGYIEALFGDFHGVIMKPGTAPPSAEYRKPTFSDLAPETLARIIADCAVVPAASGQGDRTFMHSRGAQFWRVRNIGDFSFPPLTAYLGDDGKVYLREAA